LAKEFDKIEKARSASESSERGTTLEEDSGYETLLEIDSEIESEYLDCRPLQLQRTTWSRDLNDF